MVFWQRVVVGLALVLIVVTLLALAAPRLEHTLAPFLNAERWRTWREWIRSFGALAPVVSIGISAAQIVPLPIPGPTLPLVNGWLFGIWGGMLVSWCGVMLNALGGFLLARGPGRRLFLRLVSARQLRRAEKALEAHGAMAVVVARMFPVLPFSAISVAAGLLHMSGRRYLIATALGILPSTFALSLIGWQLSRGALEWAQIVLAAGILGALGLLALPLAAWYRSE